MENSKKDQFVLRRKELGITQEEIAKALNLNPRAISDWENGRHKPRLSFRQTAILCDMLKMSVHELADIFEPISERLQS